MLSKRETFGPTVGEALAAIVVGADMIVSYANDAAHRLFGYPPGTLVGAFFEMLAPYENRMDLQARATIGMRRDARKVRAEAVRVDGRRIDVNVSMRPLIRSGGEVAGLIVTYQPVAPLAS